MCHSNRLKLNVGGYVFNVPQATLARLPGTRLSSLKPNDTHFDTEHGEFYFDRNSSIFPYILDVYRKGKLHFPRYLCGPLLWEELKYWGIPETLIADCCWKTYASFAHEQNVMREVNEALYGECSEIRKFPDDDIVGYENNAEGETKPEVLTNVGGSCTDMDHEGVENSQMVSHEKCSDADRVRFKNSHVVDQTYEGNADRTNSAAENQPNGNMSDEVAENSHCCLSSVTRDTTMDSIAREQICDLTHDLSPASSFGNLEKVSPDIKRSTDHAKPRLKQSISIESLKDRPLFERQNPNPNEPSDSFMNCEMQSDTYHNDHCNGINTDIIQTTSEESNISFNVSNDSSANDINSFTYPLQLTNGYVGKQKWRGQIKQRTNKSKVSYQEPTNQSSKNAPSIYKQLKFCTYTKRFGRRIYDFLETPRSSRGAMIWAWFFLSIVLLSVAIQCISTHPDARVPIPGTEDDKEYTNTSSNETYSEYSTGPSTKTEMYLTTNLLPALHMIQRACLGIFAVEHIVRFVTCPNKRIFFKNVFNIVDIISFFPMLALEVLATVYYSTLRNRAVFQMAFLLSLTGILKVFRIVKFAIQYDIMKVLLLSLRASLSHIALLLVLISVGMLLFSTLIYYAEFYTSNFDTIPIGFWWAIVTMTTVGYGDTHPITGWGYVVGSICAIAGMICTGLPLPVIANNFNKYYTYARVCTFKHKRLKYLRAKRSGDSMVQITEL